MLIYLFDLAHENCNLNKDSFHMCTAANNSELIIYSRLPARQEVITRLIVDVFSHALVSYPAHYRGWLNYYSIINWHLMN